MSSDRWLYGWALGYAAVGAASLLIPLYALSLGAGPLLVGLMASTAAFAGVPGAILWGKLASKTGRRRRFVLVALAATAAVLAVIPAIESPMTVLAANAALWFVVSAAAPVLNLIVVEGVPVDGWERRFGLLNHYQGYGWLGGLLAGAGWNAVATRVVGPLAAQRTFFFVCAGAAALGLVAVRAWYPEKPTVSERRFADVYRRIGRRGWGAGRYVRAVPFGPNRLFWALRSVDFGSIRGRLPAPLARYLAAITLCFVAFSVFFGPLPAFLTGANYSTGQIFALFVVSSAGSAVSYARVADLAAGRDVRRLQAGALTARVGCFPLVAAVGLALPASVGLLAVGGLFALVGVSWAVIAVTATGLVTRLSPESMRGEVLGLYTALAGVGGGLGSALGGLAAERFGYLATFGLAGALVLVGVVLVLGAAAPANQSATVEGSVATEGRR
jgi:MFS family permease